MSDQVREMSSTRLTRRQYLSMVGAAAAGSALAACAPSGTAVSSPTPAAATATAAPTAAPAGRLATRAKVSHGINFFAQSAQGGFWAALKDGEYERLNIDVTMRQGNPQISPVTMVASGQHDFNQQTSDTILLSRAQGIPLVALMTTFSISPLGVMYHAQSPLKSFADLKGRIAYLGFTSNWYRYIVKKFELEGKFEARNYTGQLSLFLADKSVVTQCFVTTEPFIAKKQGFDVGFLRVADSGYNPYTNVLFTSEKMIQDRADVVQAVVTAGLRGWKSYTERAKDYLPFIKEQNTEYDIELAVETQKAEQALYTGDPYDFKKFGLITMERMKTIHDQMREVGVLDKNVDVSKSFAPQFLEKAFSQI
jgi:NitT/TauT family transport system substrate-binding protein